MVSYERIEYEVTKRGLLKLTAPTQSVSQSHSFRICLHIFLAIFLRWKYIGCNETLGTISQLKHRHRHNAVCYVLCGGQPQTGASAGKEDPVVCGTNTQSGCLWFVSAPFKCVCSNLMGNTFVQNTTGSSSSAIARDDVVF